MSEFDPYLKWLGIRDATRPLNHYRLLGLELFESDKEVISMAGDRQMTHIRTYQSGPNGKVSQRILNELARARRCLLDDQKKAAYDNQLRAGLAASSVPVAPANAPPVQPPIAQPPVAQPIVDSAQGVPQVSPQPQRQAQQRQAQASPVNIGVRTDPNARQRTRKREKKQLIWGLISWVSGGLAAVGVGAFLIGSGILGNISGKNPDPDNSTSVVEKDSNGDKEIVDKPITIKTTTNDSVAVVPADSVPNSRRALKDPEATDSSEATEATDSSESKRFEMPLAWTLDNVAKYPQPSSAERSLLLRVAADFAQDRVGKLESSAPSTAGAGGVRQMITGLKRPGIMIGVSYLLDSDFNIKKLQPVFRTASSINRIALADSLLAKPGYAVGEMEVSVLNPIKCIRLRFMKVTPAGLDSQDSYLGPWIGHRDGPVRTIANSLNAPIVGSYSDFDRNDAIRTFGLIAAHRSMPPTKIKPSVVSSEKRAIGVGGNNSAESANISANISGSSLPVVSRTPIATKIFTTGKFNESIVFVNKLDADVTVYKVDANSKLSRYTTVRPGVRRTASSELGRHWHVKKGDLSIATYRAERGRNTAIIDGRDPDLSGSTRSSEVAGLQKNPIPSSSDRNKAMKEIKELYGELISGDQTRYSQNNSETAKNILEDFRDSSDDLAVQYVMLDRAKQISIIQGDCRTAILVLRALDRNFEGIEFWDEAVGAVQSSGKNLGRNGDRFLADELELVLRGLIDESIQSSEMKTAGRLIAFGIKAASRNGDAKALQFYKAKDKQADEVVKLRKQYENAVSKLESDPENSTANVNKGRYLLAVRGDFAAALQCWKLSDDDELLAIVKDESNSDANASFLARRWQNLGGNAKTAFGRGCYERAIEVLRSAGKLREASELQKLLDQ